MNSCPWTPSHELLTINSGHELLVMNSWPWTPSHELHRIGRCSGTWWLLWTRRWTSPCTSSPSSYTSRWEKVRDIHVTKKLHKVIKYKICSCLLQRWLYVVLWLPHQQQSCGSESLFDRIQIQPCLFLNNLFFKLLKLMHISHFLHKLYVL